MISTIKSSICHVSRWRTFRHIIQFAFLLTKHAAKFVFDQFGCPEPRKWIVSGLSADLSRNRSWLASALNLYSSRLCKHNMSIYRRYVVCIQQVCLISTTDFYASSYSIGTLYCSTSVNILPIDPYIISRLQIAILAKLKSITKEMNAL